MDTTLLRASPKAKINLRLKVLDKLKDRDYHILSMINVCCSLRDELDIEINKSAKTSISVDLTGNNALSIEDQRSNLCFLAASYFLDSFQINAEIKISLKKNIPVGAGLGGGSSDAASVLKLLSDYFKVDQDLTELACKLGADVPYFLETDSVALVTGIGEKVQPINCPELKGWPCLLINPGIHISTKVAFEDLNFAAPKIDSQAEKFSGNNPQREFFATDILELISNDFLNQFKLKYPDIVKELEILCSRLNSVYSLSGTGSTFFLIPRERNFDFVAHKSLIEEHFLNKKYNIFYSNLE